MTLSRKSRSSRNRPARTSASRSRLVEQEAGALREECAAFRSSERGDLVHETTHKVLESLVIGMLLVTAVLVLFLGDFRAAIIAAINIPLALLIAFAGLVLTHTSANLISLGAVDGCTTPLASSGSSRCRCPRTDRSPIRRRALTFAALDFSSG